MAIHDANHSNMFKHVVTIIYVHVVTIMFIEFLFRILLLSWRELEREVIAFKWDCMPCAKRECRARGKN
uniref:Uncharacterized protein n=1 Tax=Octopus bimaculoides TaxID=37653 RepID=A0A0L8G7T3_OCTBM